MAHPQLTVETVGGSTQATVEGLLQLTILSDGSVQINLAGKRIEVERNMSLNRMIIRHEVDDVIDAPPTARADDDMTIQQEKTTEEVEHDLDESVTKQINRPGETAGMWVASCTCKKYTCRPKGTPEDARRQVYQHIRKIWRQIERSR